VRLRRTVVADLRTGDSYALVLVLLLAAVFCTIVAPDETWGRIFRDTVLASTVLVTYWTATARHSLFVPRVLVPGLVVAFVVVGAIEGSSTDAVAAAFAAVFTVGAIVLVAHDLFERGRVDAQTVLGALSLYVLIGILFAALYAFFAATGDSSFFTRGDDGTTGEHLYFSLAAITTTGFGDLAPASSVGRALASLELVLGQLYLVTVVTVIVAAAMRRPPGRDARSESEPGTGSTMRYGGASPRVGFGARPP
jgi:hypothetical protein